MPAPTKRSNNSSSSTFSVIGSDVVITGNVTAEVDLHIDGRVEGGAADWSAKAYIRAHPQVGATWEVGDVASFYNRHVLSVVG